MRAGPCSLSHSLSHTPTCAHALSLSLRRRTAAPSSEVAIDHILDRGEDAIKGHKGHHVNKVA